jgi:predicted permease
MLTTLSVIAPIFALVFVGWFLRRMDIFGPTATSELNRFVVLLALPALLFDIVANARLQQIWQPAFVGTFLVGCGIVFALTLVLRLRSRHLADAAVDGLNTAYANTGFIGFPLALAVLGQSALVPTLVSTIITVCIVFAVAIILIEFSLQTGGSKKQIARKIILSLVKNPLLIAPVLGALLSVSGLPLPQPAGTFFKLLGGAASPCALIALGLFLGEKRSGAPGTLQAATLLTAMKLALHPLVAWLLAVYVFGLSTDMTKAAVLLAALPTGTGSFMLAEFYGREASITSRTILLSTALSIGSLTLLFAVW